MHPVPPLTSQALAIGLTVIIHKNPKPGGGGGYSGFQVTGIIKWQQKSKTKKSVALPTNPKKLWNKIYPLKATGRISKLENSLQ